MERVGWREEGGNCILHFIPLMSSNVLVFASIYFQKLRHLIFEIGTSFEREFCRKIFTKFCVTLVK